MMEFAKISPIVVHVQLIQIKLCLWREWRMFLDDDAESAKISGMFGHLMFALFLNQILVWTSKKLVTKYNSNI